MRFIYLIFVLLVQIPAQASSHQLDSLLNVLEDLQEKGSKKELIKIHFTIGNHLSSKSEEKYKQSIYHYDLSAELALSQKDYISAALAIFLSGESHRRTNNFQEALAQFYRVIEFDEGLINELNRARAYSMISSIYQALGNYEKAFEQQMKGLLISEVIEDSLGIANGHYNIGTIFFYQLQYEKALESYQNAKEIKR